jgi:hypothetical protein
MAEPVTIISERGDHDPLFLGHLERMGELALLYEHFHTYGNKVGLILVRVTVVRRLKQQVLRVFHLQMERLRLDRTLASGCWTVT